MEIEIKAKWSCEKAFIRATIHFLPRPGRSKTKKLPRRQGLQGTTKNIGKK